MSKLKVPAGWEDLDFLFEVETAPCGGSCTLEFDETGAPKLVSNCVGDDCDCMPVFGSLVPFARARSGIAVPWPCVGPTAPDRIIDLAIERYLRVLRQARLMRRLAILFGLTTLGLGMGMAWMWLAR